MTALNNRDKGKFSEKFQGVKEFFSDSTENAKDVIVDTMTDFRKNSGKTVKAVGKYVRKNPIRTASGATLIGLAAIVGIALTLFLRKK